MHVHLIAVGERMPDWVVRGYQEYSRRLPRQCSLKLLELAPGQRSKSSDPKRAIQEEGERMLAAIPKGSFVVALDERGTAWRSRDLANQFEAWMLGGRDVALLVGGPDGLAPTCLARAEQRWSLSSLTLPHPLVRVVIAEQLYRAWSISQGHPYHRE